MMLTVIIMIRVVIMIKVIIMVMPMPMYFTFPVFVFNIYKFHYFSFVNHKCLLPLFPHLL